jgi:hypothetical protein
VQGIMYMPDLGRTLCHVWGIAIAVTEIDPPGDAVAFLPAGDGRGKCRPGRDQHQFGPRSGDREGRRRLAGRTGPVED